MTASSGVARVEVEVALEAVQEGVAAVGTVIATGADDAAVAALAGRRVLVSAREPCGDCEVCRRGGATACPTARIHALATTTRSLRVATRWLVELGDGLDLPGPSAAAAAGDLALAYTLYARSNLSPSDPVVVIGATPVARFVVDVLLAKGIAPVVAVASPPAAADAPTAWRTWLEARGVGVAELDAARIAEAFAARDGAAGATAARAARPWRIVVADDALGEAIALAPPRAQLTVLTVYVDVHVARVRGRPRPRLDSGTFTAALAREVTIMGVAAPHPDLVLEAAALAARGDIDLDASVITLPAAAPPPADSTRTLVRLISARER